MELKGKTKSILVTILLVFLLAAKLFQSWKGHGAPERERSILFPEVSEVFKKLTPVPTGPWSGKDHTWGADLPGGRGWRKQKSYLEKWEKEVAANKLGARGFE
mgnify:CR=1 FL=1